MLARQVLYHLGYTSSPACFSYFSDKVSGCFLPRDGLYSPNLCLSDSWDYRHVSPCLAANLALLGGEITCWVSNYWKPKGEPARNLWFFTVSKGGVSLFL
jgi:hypothetical protein